MPARTVASRSALKSQAKKPASKALRASAGNARPAGHSQGSSEESEFEEERQPKRRKTSKGAKPTNGDVSAKLFGIAEQESTSKPCTFPGRIHSTSYHRPLLLDTIHGRTSRDALFKWFDSISTKRGMPWRKPWLGPMPDVDPAERRKAYEKRAYEVWISEIMLQQTRVAVVIDYWNNWMAKWPTIQDLAAADADDVLAAWRGLGYYSRATRIHEAAKVVVNDPEMNGLLPKSARDLESKIPGVGRYTAGAISSIVFGQPEPMVDGNVLRVLSRQLGLLADVKTTKAVIDLLWAAADTLAKTVAKDGISEGDETQAAVPESDRPGRWGQALMELGSTVCAPKPNCGECPISGSCKAFAEGKSLFKTKAVKQEAVIGDIEDLCTICEPFDDSMLADEGAATKEAQSTKKSDAKKAKSNGQAKLTAFAFTAKSSGKKIEETPEPTPKASDDKSIARAVEHAKLFPLKVIKKAVRQEETLVCAIRRSDGQYLIERRPEKGLLAGLWEFPSKPLSESDDNSASARKATARSWVQSLVEAEGSSVSSLKFRADLGNVPWVFSHLKLTMHVYLFELDSSSSSEIGSTDRRRWSGDVEAESMGTGMRKCWALVRDAEA
ncbi:NUDIX domain-containing protein [Sarocladium implicatum]|nr:NUDIX domain-containing protein [Sarocladium implicatum]